MSDVLGPENEANLPLSAEAPPVARPALTIPQQMQPPAILFDPMPFPSIGQAIAMTLLLLAAQVICGIGMGIVAAIMGSSGSEWLGVGSLSIINLIAFSITYWIGLRWSRLKSRDALFLRSVPLKLLLPMIVTTLGLVPLLNELGTILVLLSPPSDFVNRMFNVALGGDDAIWKAVLFLAVVAPITEEPIFRGLLLGGLLKRYTPIKAILVSSVLFAFIHLNIYQFLTATLLGLLYGWWFLKTRSLWPSLLGHATNNAIVFLVPLFPVSGGFRQDVPQFQAVWFDLIALVVFCGGFAWTRHAFNGLTPSVEPIPIAVETAVDTPLA